MQIQEKQLKELSPREKDRIIEMAWEDRTTFDAIEFQFGLSEAQVIQLMRQQMKPSSFKMWRKRVSGRKTKHANKRNFEAGRFKCSRQRSVSNNKISKR
ncbi:MULTISPECIES: TIGR03643 family protein [unclassified Aureispira]|uniref:TIGR03643 family protein n=1 Tax=unclassified Aureispira TaxID=2649989 RepID=UPI000697C916|nr:MULTISPECIES: TIGR03643 family protein [unclassified Aureispira]WMX15594.1 TIGR03643 family protein [Aureispira sp. CCB-E]